MDEIVPEIEIINPSKRDIQRGEVDDTFLRGTRQMGRILTSKTVFGHESRRQPTHHRRQRYLDPGELTEH